MTIAYNDLDRILPKIQDLTNDMPRLYISHKLHHLSDPEERAFKILISSVISLRTKEKATWEVSERLYQKVQTLDDLLSLSVPTIEKLLYSCGFYKQKTRQIITICQHLKTRFNGKVPENIDELLSLPGVGRKVANLVVTEAFGKKGICVDIHVHRISNRWGLVKTKDPDETEMVLRRNLPEKWWPLYNQILVVFGQNICLSVNPKCPDCFLSSVCPSSRSFNNR